MKLRSLCLGLSLLCSASVAAAPAHYLVFELDQAGRAIPLFHTQVDIDLDPQPIQVPALEKARFSLNGELQARARGYRDGQLQHAESLRFDTLQRLEFGHPDGHIGQARSDRSTQHFVIRLPASADELRLDLGRGEQRFDLRELEKNSAQLPLAGIAAGSVIADKQLSGPPSNRLDVLVMGDGFQASEASQFTVQTRIAANAMVDTPPFSDFRELINLNYLFTPSQQSGADHPPYQAGCTTTSCCADPAAQFVTTPGRFVNTAFDARFCAAQIHRLLVVDAAKVLAAAAAVPDWDMILMVVNDEAYGGAGGTMPVTSSHPAANLVAVHEVGHSFARLADEYTTPFPGFGACSDLVAGRSCEPNVTDQTQRDQIKWRDWIPATTPVPTPAATPGVGLFEGARYLTSGIYRPVHSDCLMARLNAPAFCPVCAQAYVLSLYQGGWGVPSAGIDLIEPGSEVPSSNEPVVYQAGTTQRFSAEVLASNVPGMQQQWFLDGTPIEGATDSFIDFQLAEYSSFQHRLELRVTDRSAYLQPAMAGALAEHSRVWTLQPEAGGGPGEIAMCSALSGAWFDPVTPGQGFLFDVVDDPSLLFGAWFTYAADGRSDWLTIQGLYGSSDAGGNFPVYQVTGGVFGMPSPVLVSEVGNAELNFADCEHALLRYTLEDGRSGEIALERLTPTPDNCSDRCARVSIGAPVDQSD